MEKFLGLSTANWMIWVTMVVFIIGYFIVAEILNKREDKK